MLEAKGHKKYAVREGKSYVSVRLEVTVAMNLTLVLTKMKL